MVFVEMHIDLCHIKPKIDKKYNFLGEIINENL